MGRGSDQGQGARVAVLGTRRGGRSQSPPSGEIPGGRNEEAPLEIYAPTGGLTELLITWAEPMFSFPVECSFFHPGLIVATYLFQTVVSVNREVVIWYPLLESGSLGDRTMVANPSEAQYR